MSLSTLLVNVTATAVRAAEETHEQVINPWIVGAIAFGILMLLLIGLVSFGGGREHS